MTDASLAPIEATPIPPPRAPASLIMILSSLSAFGPLAIDMYLPSLPEISRELHAGHGAAQFTVAAYVLGLALGQVVYGPLSDRIGRRKPLLFGIGLFVAASVGCAVATSMEMLITLRFVQALGGCAGVVLSRAMVRDLFTTRESVHIYALLMLVMGVAPILAPLAGGYVLLVSGWRTIFLLIAGFAALVAGAVFLFLPETRHAHAAESAREETPLNAYLALLRTPGVLAFSLAGSFATGSLFTYISGSPSLMIGVFHISPQAFGWIFGLNSLGIVASTQLNRRLTRNIEPWVVLHRGSLVAVAAGILLMISAFTGLGGMVGMLICLFLVLGTFGVVQPNALVSAMAVDPRRAGSTSAIYGVLQYAVGAGAAALMAALGDGTKHPIAEVIFGCVLLSALAANAVRVHVRREANRDPIA